MKRKSVFLPLLKTFAGILFCVFISFFIAFLVRSIYLENQEDKMEYFHDRH